VASETTIFTDVDFEREGKRAGLVRLPHPPQVNACGLIPIPMALGGGTAVAARMNPPAGGRV
jgi:hypothetical protein